MKSDQTKSIGTSMFSVRGCMLNVALTLFVFTSGSAPADVHYVDANSTNATPPYSSWATAATNIQDAVDAALAVDEIVVTNGIYSRVVVNKPLSVRSVNGSEATMIDGAGSGTCVSLDGVASLSGFTLINGHAVMGGGAVGGTLNNCTLMGNRALGGETSAFGGGAAYCTLINCVLKDNRASVSHGMGYPVPISAYGGGAYRCTLDNCTLTGNSANAALGEVREFGGGASDCTLRNCTLTGNSAYYGGGVYRCTLNNCIVYFNQGANSDASLGGSTLRYCCTTPRPNTGVANITNAPLFVDQTSGNLRLQSNSPCINAANNSYVTSATDLDGNPRIIGGTVDIGAYEYQSLDLINSGVVSNQFGFTVTGQSNWVIVLDATSDFSNWTPLTTNTLGPHPFPFRDPSPPNLPQRFYRARLQ